MTHLTPTCWPALPLFSAEAEVCRKAHASRASSTFRVLTWNVWFDPLLGAERQCALIREVLLTAPDVACFQEVVPEFARTLRESETVCSLFDVSPFEVGTYGDLQLVRRACNANFELQRMPTKMGRSAVISSWTSLIPGLHVASAHLESLNSPGTRRKQLAVLAERLAASPTSVICGDFNFDSTKTWGDWKRGKPACPPEELENKVLLEVLPEFVDVWPLLRPDEEGITFDGKENPICVQDSDEQMRYDRILARAGPLQPVAIQMLGREDINDWGARPSDHFGLCGDFEVRS